MYVKSSRAAQRLATLDPSGTVFAEFTALANKHGAVNLGQGFPALPVPKFITDAATAAVSGNGLLHQYTRSEGHIRLAKALATYYTAKLGRRALDPLSEILTCAGASEAIHCAMQAFINSGDEVIIMQPFYDCYEPSVRFAGGVPVFTSLRPPPPNDDDGRPAAEKTSRDWEFDIEEIRGKCRRGVTKMIVVNNPHNPIGKVFTRAELEQIADVAREFDLLVLADEVYETLSFAEAPFVKFATLPGMYDRTITVGSLGKMLGITGWKIGWCLAPAPLTRAIWLIHQYVPFCVATPLQEAAAVCLEHAITASPTYFADTAKQYARLRDRLHAHLAAAGMRPTLPEGGYFILADTSNVNVDKAATTKTGGGHGHDGDDDKDDERRDYAVCRELTEHALVTAIPPSAFYSAENKADLAAAGRLARFAFCKNEEMLDDAGAKLKAYFKKG
ncbi:Kynurenine--oxoglutarate transaminase 3 [Geranomyces variabilis]|uniref:Kynurenine--oxoglutarate transaminase 3 n=1 Tax=Geranomyces variabilis TaxID=109894 RepID=A0AAD5THH3_9FUNG|nr:Kynurenine--oxoglutarate transaminase 3 [Geranomyces variabilis]